MAKPNHLVCVQHLLPSVAPLLKRVQQALDDRDIVVAGKPYSTIPATIADLEAGGVSRLYSSPDDVPIQTLQGASLILDEGGRLHDRVPASFASGMAGVEQTTAGMRSPWKYPTVLVCRSAAKLIFESQIVGRGILRKLDSLELLAKASVGIIGSGAVGSELALQLRALGLPVAVHDIRPLSGTLAELSRPLDELLATSNLILGATGRDCLAGVSLCSLAPSVVFASCSSSNTEFASIGRFLGASCAFGPATGTIGQSTVVLLNGGYPINFDRQQEWETADEIDLTRQLCFHGLLQARSLVGSDPRGVMLDPKVQVRLVSAWLERVPEREALRIPKDLDEHYFQARSEGEFR